MTPNVRIEVEGGWQRTLAEHRSTTRGRILVAAIAVMSEQGMAAASMSAIAERAEVSRPTLYRYFPDIDHIMAAVVEAQFDAFRTALDVAVHDAGSAREKLRRVIDVHIDQYASEPEALVEGAMETGLSPTVRAVLERELTEHHQRLVDVLREGVAEGSLRPDLDPDLQGELLQHVLGGLRMTVKRRRGDLATLAAEVTAMVLHGLAPPDPRAAGPSRGANS